MVKRKITMDDLARITQQGFLDLDAKLSSKIDSLRADNQKEHEQMNENIQNVQDTTNRIETLQKSELNRADEHSVALRNHKKRLVKLESVH